MSAILRRSKVRGEPRVLIKLLSAAGLVTLCLTLSLQATKAGDALRGMPRVIDGNTIELAGQRLRLHGIDAPELGQVCELRGKPYDCGEISRAALLDLTAGTPILCRPIESESGTAYCFAEDYDLSSGMVYTGWALADREVTDRYVETEAGARDGKRGLWRGRFVAPWDWRAGERLDLETATAQ